MSDALHIRPPPVTAFALSWLMLALLAFAAWRGGWWIALVPFLGFGVPALLDRLTPLNLDNPALSNDAGQEGWTAHRLAIAIWPALQFITLLAALWLTCRTDHLSTLNAFALFAVIGTITGAIGIVYAHELMHRQGRLERFLGDCLMAMVFYSHFRSEHLQVHHRYVGTPRDTVTAREGENLFAFYARVVPASLVSAWQAEADRLRQRGRPLSHRSNPFWTYLALQGAMVALALVIGGWKGLALLITQAAMAIIYLEATNYIEHYGLMRREIAPGRYEPVALHHSWNSSHRFTNYMLINLPRHPDHHFRPDRDYQLLQTYTSDSAPQMPHSYPVMVALAFVPPVWMRMMNPRVLKWRARFQQPSDQKSEPLNI